MDCGRLARHPAGFQQDGETIAEPPDETSGGLAGETPAVQVFTAWIDRRA